MTKPWVPGEVATQHNQSISQTHTHTFLTNTSFSTSNLQHTNKQISFFLSLLLFLVLILTSHFVSEFLWIFNGFSISFKVWPSLFSPPPLSFSLFFSLTSRSSASKPKWFTPFLEPFFNSLLLALFSSSSSASKTCLGSFSPISSW